MGKTLFLWNFINLMDAEGGWFLQLILVLIGLLVVTQILKYVFNKLEKSFDDGKNEWRGAFLHALIRPLNSYILFVVIVYAINLVSDQLLSEQFSYQYKVSFHLFAIFMVAWFLFRWKKNAFAILYDKQKRKEIEIDRARLQAVNKLAAAVIFVFTLLLLMEATHQNFATLIAFGGISGLALAIASQEIISNFYGGLMVYVTRPFGVGDSIQLPSYNIEGKVEDIGWYQTCLHTVENKPIYVPNSLFSKAYVANATRMTRRKLTETVLLRHEDFSRTPKIIEEIRAYLKDLRGVDHAELPVVNISNITLCSIDVSISFLSTYVDSAPFYAFQDEVLVKVHEIIEQAGAKIACPVQETIKMR